jgi:hypothetical protein
MTETRIEIEIFLELGQPAHRAAARSGLRGYCSIFHADAGRGLNIGARPGAVSGLSLHENISRISKTTIAVPGSLRCTVPSCA